MCLCPVNLLLSCRRRGGAVISAALSTRSFFLALIAAGLTHERVQPIFTRGSFPPHHPEEGEGEGEGEP